MIRFAFAFVSATRADPQDPELVPQEAVFPESGWSVLRIDSAALPLDEQDVLAQRNVLCEALMNALDGVQEEPERNRRVANRDRADIAHLHLEEEHSIEQYPRFNAKARRQHPDGGTGGCSHAHLRLLAEAVGDIAQQPLEERG